MKTSRRKFIQKSAISALTISTGLEAFAKPFNKVMHFNDNPAKAGLSISVFSKHLQWLDYEGMANFAASAGFDGVDLTVRPGGHVIPERVEEDLPKAVNAVRAAGLEVFMITTAITDPDDPYTDAILKTAGSLKIPFYRFGWFDFRKDVSLENNIKDFQDRFKKFSAMNSKYNICGDYQNHSGTSMGGSIWDLWLSIKEMDPRWVGCQYDVRHATVEGAFSWPVGFKLIYPFIHTVDIKDFLWYKNKGKWELRNVPLGEGMVDFKKYLELIKKYKISGPVSLHYEYEMGGAEHGNKTISLSKEDVIKILKKDLLTLRVWLKEHNLEN